jgi:hypothetical protein
MRASSMRSGNANRLLQDQARLLWARLRFQYSTVSLLPLIRIRCRSSRGGDCVERGDLIGERPDGPGDTDGEGGSILANSRRRRQAVPLSEWTSRRKERLNTGKDAVNIRNYPRLSRRFTQCRGDN